MIDLPNVTLFCISSDKVPDAIKVLQYSMRGINFGAVKLITHEDPGNLPDGIEFSQCYEIKSIHEYNYYCLYNLTNHIDTDYCLLIQPDGFVINPDKWDDDWFNYDYIGAPWPYRDRAYITPYGEHQRVGNGGFSFRSKKLLEVPLHQWIPFKVAEMSDFYQMFGGNNTNEDGNITVHNKHLYEKCGCKIAPIEVAKFFSYESPVPENTGIIPFGFHNNLPPGVTVEGYNPR